MEKNLTSGSVFHTILYFSLPYLLSYFLQTLYGMADLFIIGQFNGVDSTTAVSIGSQVMHMLTVMIVGLAMGSTVRIGHAVGARDRRQANLDIGNTAVLFMGLSLAGTVALLLAVRAIVGVMSTPAEAVAGTAAYLTICFAGVPFITAYNIISSIFRGLGDSKSPMYFVAVACGVNIALDLLFIGKLGMGPAGAALGTTLAQAVSVVVSLAVIWKRQMIPGLSRDDFRPRRNILGAILKIGIPVAVQDGFIQISFIVITIIANRRGLDDAAAVGIVEKLIGVMFLIPSTMLSTVSALSAQNIGAGQHDRVRQVLRYAVCICVAFGLICSIAMQFGAESAVALFTDAEDSAQVIHLGGQYMRGYVWDCIFAGIHFCFSGCFCAYGMSGISFLHNSVSIVCARVPLAWLTSRLFADTLLPMGFSAPAGSLLSVVICCTAWMWLLRHPQRMEQAAEG